MKKLVIAFVIIFALSFPAVYIVIPQNIEIRDSIMIGCTKDGATRVLKDNTKWQKWWPGKIEKPDTYTYRGILYNLNMQNYNGFNVMMQHKDDSSRSTIIVFPYNKDSVTIFWQGSVNTGITPLGRFLNYRSAKAYADNIHSILEHLKDYLQETKNIYNLEIQKIKVKDTLLISTKKMFAQKPSTKDVYDLIYKLKKAIAAEGSIETNFPMLNISYTDSEHFLVNVAIPVNKSIK